MKTIKTNIVEYLIVIFALVLLATIVSFAFVDAKGEALPMNSHELVITEGNEIELEGITIEPNDPNYLWFSSEVSIDIIEPSDTLCFGVNGPDIYLKNLPLLDKDEVRDYALAISAANVSLYTCDEHHQALMKLISPKLLKKPND